MHAHIYTDVFQEEQILIAYLVATSIQPSMEMQLSLLQISVAL